ncbi:MAG: ubiquinol-cytochrome c reductase iron-sulfur subunit [Candidatus Brocadiae bacterium]|nr:ubiquinol-cytochrome c reductase iron-sulfur subunit [Candidatus Brocadiia bacterium]
MPETPEPSRRDLLHWTLAAWGAGAVAGIGGILGASAVPRPQPPTTARIPKADLKDGSATASLRGTPFTLLITPAGPVAFSLACTHARCVVAWNAASSEFLCPCHGGRFDAAGRVVAGPPPAPLRRLEVADAGDAWEIRG